VSREDGAGINLNWTAGVNIGPGSGEWSGKLLDGGGVHSEIAAEDGSGKDKARIFMTTWTNDNEWYPVDKLKFTLENPGAKFIILAITGEK
jgi:hypothetical protein